MVRVDTPGFRQLLAVTINFGPASICRGKLSPNNAEYGGFQQVRLGVRLGLETIRLGLGKAKRGQVWKTVRLGQVTLVQVSVFQRSIRFLDQLKPTVRLGQVTKGQSLRFLDQLKPGQVTKGQSIRFLDQLKSMFRQVMISRSIGIDIRGKVRFDQHIRFSIN